MLASAGALVSARVQAGTLPPEAHSTALGELHSVVLENCASVTLNTSTSLRATRAPDSCEIWLERGEALFSVPTEDTWPLRVVAGEIVAMPEAGAFSVRIRADGVVEVMVKKGRVGLEPGPRGTSHAIPVAAAGTTPAADLDHPPARRRILSANQLGRVTPNGITLQELTAAEATRRLEWTNGRLSFRGQTLAEAAEEFNRYHASQLMIADVSLGSVAIGGDFVITEVDSFVAALRRLGIDAVTDREPTGTEGRVIRLVPARERPR